MNSVSKKTMKQYLAGPYLIWNDRLYHYSPAFNRLVRPDGRRRRLHPGNIAAIATQEHSKALFLSLGLSLLSTGICLLLAYPLA